MQGGSESHSIHCPTKTVVWDCDIGTDHPDVPAKSYFWSWAVANPRTTLPFSTNGFFLLHGFLKFEMHQNSAARILRSGFLTSNLLYNFLADLLNCLCTNDALHTKNSVRCFWLSVSLIPVPSRWYEPLGESLSRLTVDSKTTSEFTVFNLVIRLSKVNCWPFFDFHLSVEWVLNNFPLCLGLISFSFICIAGSHVNNHLFPTLLESLTDNLKHDMTSWRFQDMLSRCGHFPFGFLVRFNCARNSRVDYLSRPEGCELTAEGLEPDHKNAWVVDASYTFWTRSPWVPFSSFFMCPCVLLPPGRFGPLRAEVFVGSRRVRLVQALLSSPSSAGLVPCPLASAFLFSCLSRVCPFWARFHCVGVSPSLFFCVPLFASWLSNLHLIFIFTSSSFPSLFIFISQSGP